MWPIAYCSVVCVSVCLLGAAVNQHELQMAEPIKMLFVIWTQVGPRNHVLGEGPDFPRVRGNFWRGHPTRCGFSSEFFDHLSLCE